MGVFLLAHRYVNEMLKVIFEEFLICFNFLQDAHHRSEDLLLFLYIDLHLIEFIMDVDDFIFN